MDAQVCDLQSLYSSEDEEPEFDEPVEQPKLSKGPTLQGYMYAPHHLRFNLKYNILHSNIVPLASFQRRPIELTDTSEPAYLLGNSYNHTQMDQFLKHFRFTIWMSYRSSADKTDAGWGCTIRAVQMAVAEAIKRNNPSLEAGQVV